MVSEQKIRLIGKRAIMPCGYTKIMNSEKTLRKEIQLVKCWLPIYVVGDTIWCTAVDANNKSMTEKISNVGYAYGVDIIYFIANGRGYLTRLELEGEKVEINEYKAEGVEVRLVVLSEIEKEIIEKMNDNKEKLKEFIEKCLVADNINHEKYNRVEVFMLSKDPVWSILDTNKRAKGIMKSTMVVSRFGESVKCEYLANCAKDNNSIGWDILVHNGEVYDIVGTNGEFGIFDTFENEEELDRKIYWKCVKDNVKYVFCIRRNELFMI